MELTERKKNTKEIINYKETKDVYGWRSLTRITSDEIEEFRPNFLRCANLDAVPLTTKVTVKLQAR